MPNRARPRCPECNAAMAPLYRFGQRRQSYRKVADTFHCDEHDVIARGRQTVRFLT